MYLSYLLKFVFHTIRLLFRVSCFGGKLVQGHVRRYIDHQVIQSPTSTFDSPFCAFLRKPRFKSGTHQFMVKYWPFWKDPMGLHSPWVSHGLDYVSWFMEVIICGSFEFFGETPQFSGETWSSGFETKWPSFSVLLFLWRFGSNFTNFRVISMCFSFFLETFSRWNLRKQAHSILKLQWSVFTVKIESSGYENRVIWFSMCFGVFLVLCSFGFLTFLGSFLRSILIRYLWLRDLGES